MFDFKVIFNVVLVLIAIFAIKHIVPPIFDYFLLRNEQDDDEEEHNLR